MSSETLGDRTDERWPLLRRFRTYGRPHASFLVIGLIGASTTMFIGSVTPFVVGVAFDALFNEQPYALPLVPSTLIPTAPVEQLWFTVALLAALAVMRAVANITGQYFRGRFGYTVQHDLRVDAYDRFQRLEMAFFDDQRTGELMSVLNNDVNTLVRFFRESISSNLNRISTLVWSALFMSLLDPQLTIVAFAAAPVLVALNVWFAGTIEDVQDRARQAVGELNAVLEDNVSGIAIIKADAAEPFESGRVADSSFENFRRQWIARKVRSGYYPVVNLVTNATYVLVFIVGGYWVLRGPPAFLDATVTGGELIAFLMYTRRLVYPFSSISRSIDNYKSAKASAKRVAAIQDLDDTIDESSDAVDLDAIEGTVAYEDVYFSYADGNTILDGVRFSTDAGRTVGLVGPTGAGKSTLMKLLLRFYDVDSGAILVDGEDVREITLRSLRESIGYVSQDPFLFYGTVGENIAYGDPHATAADVREAAKLANVHEFVTTLPEGYDTQVGERGVKLSGGQRQRIAIARAVVGDPPILIFDEATSHVDNETEVLIRHSMERITADRTTFVIAHRLSTVRNADTILVLEDGRVVERGDHDELLEADGLYATLWGVQVGEVDELPDDFADRTAGSS